MSRTIRSTAAGCRPSCAAIPLFEDFGQALRETRPDAVSINT